MAEHAPALHKPGAGHGKLRMLLHLCWWDMVSQYFGSVIGVFWNILLPAVVIGIYLAVFELTPGFRFGGRETVGGYGINLVVGLIPWLLFQEGVSRAASAFVDSRHLLTQIPIPAPLFPLASVGSALVRHLVGLLLFVGILAALGILPGISWLAMLITLPILLLLSTGVALVFACLTVLQRDVAPTVNAAMLPLFFATPIIYPSHIAPPTLAVLMDLNPLTPIVLAYRDALVTGRWPLWDGLLYSFVFGLLTLAIGAVLVRRVGPELAERM